MKLTHKESPLCARGTTRARAPHLVHLRHGIWWGKLVIYGTKKIKKILYCSVWPLHLFIYLFFSKARVVRMARKRRIQKPRRWVIIIYRGKRAVGTPPQCGTFPVCFLFTCISVSPPKRGTHIGILSLMIMR